MHLLHALILEKHPHAKVFIQSNWPQCTTGAIAPRGSPEAGYPAFADGERYFLFDEGQTTYWDDTLWGELKDTIQATAGSTANSVHAILFCSYGKTTQNDQRTKTSGRGKDDPDQEGDSTPEKFSFKGLHTCVYNNKAQYSSIRNRL